MMEGIQSLITELEHRCPSCSFNVTTDPPKVLITEYGRKFVVRLIEQGETAKEWFQRAIEDHPVDKTRPLQPNEKYCVLCPRCGRVAIGYGNYRDQMGRPDSPWHCPRCGGPATFDDETYENYQEG